MEKTMDQYYSQDVRVSNIFNEKTVLLIQNKDILDLGTHQGHVANVALSLGARSITGIEKSSSHCETGRLLFPTINFVNKDLNTDNYLDLIENADVIFCLGVSYYVQDISAMISTISSVAKVKTIIFETAFFEENIEYPPYNFMSENALREIFINNNFQIKDVIKYEIDTVGAEEITGYEHMQNKVLFVLNRD